MAEDPNDYLEKKILGLAGVEKRSSPDGGEAFFRGDVEFAKWADKRIRLYLTEECRAKIGQALASDPRANPVPGKPNKIDLDVGSEIDVELVFVYIRYAWKFAL